MGIDGAEGEPEVFCDWMGVWSLGEGEDVEPDFVGEVRWWHAFGLILMVWVGEENGRRDSKDEGRYLARKELPSFSVASDKCFFRLLPYSFIRTPSYEFFPP